MRLVFLEGSLASRCPGVAPRSLNLSASSLLQPQDLELFVHRLEGAGAGGICISGFAWLSITHTLG